ncbi:hypothetical protein MHK_006033 [Candidatus Magnetomorum sp. HK-1]|nr:hypothetical protein MHK_006033 [Candidatus Magnetomorum sp. HK-1]
MKRKKNNPKSHDGLFKWLITSFFEDFFGHYFPNINIGKFSFIDKEFISKYEALKESLKGDLFVAVEIEIDGHFCEVIIHIENQSYRKNVAKRVFEYLCYAWLLKEKPVWSIVFYTDDAIWRKRVPENFWYGFDSQNIRQFHKFDVIKIKDEMSNDLIQKQSLLCMLLALKANDKGLDRESLIRDIYQKAAKMKQQLTNDQLLLIEQFVDFYKKIPQETFEIIKKEVDMSTLATTISEHIWNDANKKGEKKGEVKGKINLLETLFQQAVLTKEQFEQLITPLRKKYQELGLGDPAMASA